VPGVFSNNPSSLSLLVLDTFTAANGTQITSRACDTGQTPAVGTGVAANATITSNISVFSSAGVYYTASRAIRRITASYNSIQSANQDLVFYIANTGSFVTDSYFLRFNNGSSPSVFLMDLAVGVLSWTTGTATGTWTSGTVEILPTAVGITVTIVDGSLGTRVLTYAGAMRNSTSVYGGINGNSASPCFDDLKLYG